MEKEKDSVNSLMLMVQFMTVNGLMIVFMGKELPFLHQEIVMKVIFVI
jgi:hypothetical protein